MKVIILAAGQGKRLRPITDNIPKSLVKLGDKTIIEHSLDSLSECGIKDVIIVSGFYSDKMKALLGDYYKGCRIKHCVNEDYANNDNMFSMWVAKDEITEDIMYFNADVICNSEIIKNLINSSHKNVIVIDDINPIEADHMKVRIEEGKLKEIRRDLEDTNARAIGMYKLCLDDARKYYSNIEQLVSEGKIKSKIEIPMTMMFPELEIHALSTGNNTWFEIDDINSKIKFE